MMSYRVTSGINRPACVRIAPGLVLRSCDRAPGIIAHAWRLDFARWLYLKVGEFMEPSKCWHSRAAVHNQDIPQ